MKYSIFTSCVLILGFSGPGYAQDAAVDDAFRALQALASPAPAKGATSDEREADRRRQIAAFVAAAEKAREFYAKHPTHAKAIEARKIEATALLSATREGAVEHEAKALRVAKDFRFEARHSSADRYEVAAFMRELDVRKQNHGESRENVLAAYEKAAKDLYGEFPNEPRVFDLFLGVARNAAPVKARQVANDILLMPAPAQVKDEARAILGRLDMVGQPITLEFTDEAGTAHHLASQKGKIVVFFVWATWAAAADPGAAVKARIPRAATTVSVNVDQDVTRGKSEKAKLGVSGISYFDPRGMGSPLARQLGVTKVPGFYVINARGEFVGSARAEELDELLQRAAR